MAVEDCIFCKVIDDRIPSSRVFEDEYCIAFNDISPQAPVHILIVPREHFDSLDAAAKTHQSLLGHLMLVAAELARANGFSGDGYRVVINTNKNGGQTVFHLHVHLLGGRAFIFPPG